MTTRNMNQASRIALTVISLAFTLLFLNPKNVGAETEPVPFLAEAGGPAGLVMLAENTGTIYACSAVAKTVASPGGPSIIPAGDCQKIGNIPSGALTGTGFVVMGPTGTKDGIPYGIAYAGNLSTGHVAACTFYGSSPVRGKCITIMQASSHSAGQ